LSLSPRRRLVLCVFALLACWPVVQRILVAHWNANPWELGGFAMYVQPNLSVDVFIRAPSGEAIEPERFGPEVMAALGHYRDHAEVLGLLASADDLAMALRRAGLSHAYVDIEVARPALTAEGMLITRSRYVRVNLP
jgi:hypothetical protein